MKSSILTAALLLSCAGVFAILPIASAQDEAASPAKGKAAKAKQKAGPTPRTADGKVDFTGIWNFDRNFTYDIQDSLTPGEKLPLQPWAEKLARERPSKDDPEAQCLPTGVPRQAPYPWRITQNNDMMFFLFEGNIHSYRQIFLDNPKHPDNWNPNWYGHSAAKWDGDTLVIDTVGFNDKFWFDFAGHPHTEQLHVVERFNRPDSDHLTFDTTIDDPGAYTKPFVMHGKSTYASNTELMEFICNENNKDLDHIVGKDPRNHYSAEPAPGVPANPIPNGKQ